MGSRQGDMLLAAAITACTGYPRVGLAVATKVLHLKRPRLVPILDRLVLEMMGVNPERSKMEEAIASAMRREGHRNIQALQRIQTQLANEGAKHTFTPALIRILDTILWSSHPAANVPGGRRTIRVDNPASTS